MRLQKALIILAFILFFLVVGTAIYTSFMKIDFGYRGEVKRLGKSHRVLKEPGVYVVFPFGVDRVEKEYMLHSYAHTLYFPPLDKNKSGSLTEDYNLNGGVKVKTRWVLVYLVTEPEKYLESEIKDEAKFREILKEEFVRVLSDNKEWKGISRNLENSFEKIFV